MKRHHDLRAEQTLTTLNQLLDRGVEKISLIIRHSERFFSEDAQMEPFMGLTPEGKAYAAQLGAALRPGPSLQLHSSFFGRCIETAYLIDKGYTRANNHLLDHNCTQQMLAPFYIKDIGTAIHMVEDQGSKQFLRNWFDNRIDDTVMEHPEKTADRLCEFMVDRIQSMDGTGVSLCVSHDWNIFPIKEFKMKMPHETGGDVGYLDGLAFYRENDQFWLTSHQCDPVAL